MNDGLMSNENSSVTNDLSLVTQAINENDRTIFLDKSNDLLSSQFDVNEMNFSTIAPEMIASDGTWPSLSARDYWSLSSFSPTTDLDFTTSSEEPELSLREQWFNVNQSYSREPYRSFLFWKRRSGNRILSFK